MDNKQLKIIYHFRVRGIGAEGVHIAGIANGFRALGHYVQLISPTGHDPTRIIENTTNFERKERVFIRLLHKLADILPQVFFEFMELAYNLIAIPRLWRSVDAKEIDLVYERYAFFNFAGALVTSVKGVPFALEVNELSGHKRVRGQFFVGLASKIEKYIFHRASLIITVSQFLEEEVTDIAGRLPVVTIPNGVPEEWLHRCVSLPEVNGLREKYQLKNKKIICFVGCLVPWHNFDLLLNALRLVQKEIPEAVLLIIGQGVMKEAIMAMAVRMNLPCNSVKFTGQIPHHIIPEFIALADVTVIPETNDFRSPIKMFEYMAMSKPLVAPRMPAIESVISHEKDGLLFVPRDKNSLSACLLNILSNPDISKQIGKNAREKIMNKFTWEIHAKRILNILGLTP